MEREFTQNVDKAILFYASSHIKNRRYYYYLLRPTIDSKICL